MEHALSLEDAQLVDGLRARDEAAFADLVDEMLWEIPLTVALHFLGIPEEDMGMLREYSIAHTINTWGRPTREQQLAVAEAVGKFWQFAGHVLERREPFLRLAPADRTDGAPRRRLRHMSRLLQRLRHLIDPLSFSLSCRRAAVGASGPIRHAPPNVIN